jgi:beta-1,4-mannosyltransferase
MRRGGGAAQEEEQGKSGRADDADANRAATTTTPPRKPPVWVVVLGDFGRSPRMQYHALSLARRGYPVRVIAAAGGSAPIPELRALMAGDGDANTAPSVSFSGVPPAPERFLRFLPSVLGLAFKALFQLLALLRLMLFSPGGGDAGPRRRQHQPQPPPCALLLQNPPAIPTLLVCLLAAARHRAALVVDWHNLAYTILALKRQPEGGAVEEQPQAASGGASAATTTTPSNRSPLLLSLLVAVAKTYEKCLGPRAAAHFCVTRAMQQWLRDETGARAAVLYDRPPDFFAPLDARAAHALLCGGGGNNSNVQAAILAGVVGAEDEGTGAVRLLREASELRARDGGSLLTTTAAASDDDQAAGPAPTAASRLLARLKDTLPSSPSPSTTPPTPRWRRGRPALAVSGTSWTPDEDFGLLLSAASKYDRALGAAPANIAARYPSVLLIAVTGRGPQREAYLKLAKTLRLKRVAFSSAWLDDPRDYAKLLGCADFGLSLHSSSSGLDLPMKALDMFGAGLPVLAARYPCLAKELVVERRTGRLFSDADELCTLLLELLDGFAVAAGAGSAAAAGGGGGGGGGGGTGSSGEDRGGTAKLLALRRGVEEVHAAWRWEGNWERVAAPVFAAAAAAEGGKRRRAAEAARVACEAVAAAAAEVAS